GEHRHLALGEVHDVGGLVDHDQGEGEARVDAPGRQPRQHLLEEDVHRSLRAGRPQEPRYERRMESSWARRAEGPDITTRPVSSRNTWSARSRASLAFCSTSRMVTPDSRFTAFRVRKISWTTRGASPSDGSSRSMSRGFSIRARATASICCSPPL